MKFTDDQLFKLVDDADKKGYILTWYTKETSGLGLVQMHAYTLYSTVDLQQNGKSYQKLFKVRNPWGKEEYTGPWNDRDPKWTDDFKKQAKFVKNRYDGFFHMPVKDFKEQLYRMDITYYKDDWEITKIEDSSTSKELVYTFTNPIDQEISIGMDIISDRMFPGNASQCEEFKTGPYWVSLYDFSDKLIDAFYISTNTGFDNLIVSDLKKGDYNIVVKRTRFAKLQKNDFTLTTYAATKKVTFQDEKYVYEKFLDTAENSDASAMFVKKGGCGNLNARAYIDKDSKTMVVEIKKTNPQETRVSIVYYGSKSGITSNVDWQDGATFTYFYYYVKSSGWVTGRKLMVDCPKTENVCFFKFNSVYRLDEIIFDEF